jgi:hypothetical protein
VASIDDPEPKTRRSARQRPRFGSKIADLSLVISVLALLASGLTAWTARDALSFNKRAQSDALKAALFSQFQQQYLAVNSQFPAQLINANFRPQRDSADYNRLEAYWLFVYSEWYATQRVNPDAFGSLWANYYAPLVGDALDIPSLRYVAEDMVASRALERGEWGPFLKEVARIAREDGEPLRPELEQRLARYNSGASE